MTEQANTVIRVVWDYFGPSAQPTAEHFLRHLKGFLIENHCTEYVVKTEQVSPVHSATYADVSHDFLDVVGPVLRPHRVYEVTRESSAATD
jgi:uncharacterized protein